MDLKKVLDQTVRELKREVNKKVLKVPEIEQKYVLLRLRNDSEERSLDPVKNWEPLFLKLGRVADFVESVGNFAVLEATSNEPWGPHGTLMADIAQATRNFNEYQMIMSILWKRLNDSGKNWRHVYKALTVLEFLVANGAERIIDDFSEHAYQVQTLVDFQFIEPNGKDQGINVRKKAQTLVALVNDKEKVREVRHKAASNRDKYRGVSSTGSIHKPSSYSSTGGGYSGDQDEERVASNSHYGGRDDDKYGAGRDKDSDRYKEDDQRGRDGQPSKDEEWSTDHERNGEYSFGQKVIDQSYNRYSGGKHDGARKDELFDDDNHVAQQGEGRLSKVRVDVPPTYEDTVLGHGSGHGRPDNTRDGGGSAAVLSQSGALGAKSQSTSAKALSTSDAGSSFFSTKLEEDLDDFDPRGIFLSSAAPTPQLDGSSFRQMQSVDSSSDSGVTAKVGGVEELFSDASFLTGSTGALSYSTPSAALGTPQAPGSQTSNTHTVGDLFTVTRGTSMLAAPDIVAFSSRDVFGSASGGEYVASVGLQLPAVVPDNSNLGSYAGASPFGGPGFTAQNSRSGGPMTGSTLSTPQLPSGYEVTAPSRPTAKKEPFAQRGMWADTLSTGLVDLDIKGPKNYPLAELGIELGSTYTFAERRKDDKSMSASMGKAMGSGSGLGLAAASNLVPPQGPGTGIGAGSGPGFSYGMGIGMRMSRGQQGVQGLAMPSGMDAGVTFGPGMGASFMGGDPPMRNGSGLPMAQGMGIVSSLEIGYGTGYSNQPR